MRPPEYFESQFRWEVDRWVFRYRQRGTPVEVTKEARDLLIARHRQRSKTATRVWIAAIFGAACLTGFGLSFKGMTVYLAIGYYGSAVLVGLMLSFWADQGVTYRLRRRRPVGEKLGFLGAWMMRVEATSWPTIFRGWIAVPMSLLLVATAKDEYGTTYRWAMFVLVGWVTLIMAFITALKLMVDWRERRRDAWRESLADARDLRAGLDD